MVAERLATKPTYTIEYFRNLGLTDEESESLISNWNRTTPQTTEEVRRGILWERANRENASPEVITDVSSGTRTKS